MTKTGGRWFQFYLGAFFALDVWRVCVHVSHGNAFRAVLFTLVAVTVLLIAWWDSEPA